MALIPSNIARIRNQSAYPLYLQLSGGEKSGSGTQFIFEHPFDCVVGAKDGFYAFANGYLYKLAQDGAQTRVGEYSGEVLEGIWRGDRHLFFQTHSEQKGNFFELWQYDADSHQGPEICFTSAEKIVFSAVFGHLFILEGQILQERNSQGDLIGKWGIRGLRGGVKHLLCREQAHFAIDNAGNVFFLKKHEEIDAPAYYQAILIAQNAGWTSLRGAQLIYIELSANQIGQFTGLDEPVHYLYVMTDAGRIEALQYFPRSHTGYFTPLALEAGSRNSLTHDLSGLLFFLDNNATKLEFFDPVLDTPWYFPEGLKNAVILPSLRLTVPDQKQAGKVELAAQWKVNDKWEEERLEISRDGELNFFYQTPGGRPDKIPFKGELVAYPWDGLIMHIADGLQTGPLIIITELDLDPVKVK